MKLCQKCVDGIIFSGVGRLAPVEFQEPVPESDCEFWAHKELNKRHAVLERIAASVGGKLGESVRKELGL